MSSSDDVRAAFNVINIRFSRLSSRISTVQTIEAASPEALARRAKATKSLKTK